MCSGRIGKRLREVSEQHEKRRAHPEGAPVQAGVVAAHALDQIYEVAVGPPRFDPCSRRNQEVHPVCRAAGLLAAGERSEEVRPFCVEGRKPRDLISIDPELVHLADDAREPADEGVLNRLVLSARDQGICGVLPDGLQHPVAWPAVFVAAAAEKALVEQRLDDIGSAPVTCSAASSVQPPANTLSAR